MKVCPPLATHPKTHQVYATLHTVLTEQDIRKCFHDLVANGDLLEINTLETQLNDEQDKVLEEVLSQEIKKLEAIE